MQRKYQNTLQGELYYLREELHRFLGDDERGWRFSFTLQRYIRLTIETEVADLVNSSKLGLRFQRKIDDDLEEAEDS